MIHHSSTSRSEIVSPYLSSNVPIPNIWCLLAYYRPQTKFTKVVFTPVCQSFCSQGEGVCLSACWDTTTPRSRHPPEQTPPSTRQNPRSRPPRTGPPLEQTPPLKQTPPGADTPLEQTPPWEQTAPSREQRRLLLRTVRILLECILVSTKVSNLNIVSTLYHAAKNCREVRSQVAVLP